MHAVTDDPAVVAILHEPGRVRARDVKADNVHVIAEVAKNKDRGQLRLAGASDPRAPPHIGDVGDARARGAAGRQDRKSTRLNSSHLVISYAVFCLKKKK